MKNKFEAKYQELAEEMKARPWMQVIPRSPQLQEEWGVDRWIAGAFSTYAVERMNGKSEEEAMAYTRKLNRRADFDSHGQPEKPEPIKDTPEGKAQFDKMVRGR